MFEYTDVCIIIIYFINIIYYHINTSLIIKFHFSSYVMKQGPTICQTIPVIWKGVYKKNTAQKSLDVLTLIRTMSRYIGKVRLVKARDGVRSEFSRIKSDSLHVECLENYSFLHEVNQ